MGKVRTVKGDVPATDVDCRPLHDPRMATSPGYACAALDHVLAPFCEAVAKSHDLTPNHLINALLIRIAKTVVCNCTDDASTKDTVDDLTQALCRYIEHERSLIMPGEDQATNEGSAAIN